MQAARIPHDEATRLAALRALGVLDTGPEEEFDALVKVASLVCGVPISLISLVDAERQWFKANIGLPGASETPRDIAFCAHAILDDALFVVNDAAADPRFADNPLVASQPDIRFYAGAPIVLSDGNRVGTLCVIDRTPRSLDATQSEILASLAVAAAQALEGRRAIREMQVLSRALQKSKVLLDRTGSLAGVGSWEVDLVKNTIYWSDETCRIHGVEPGYVPDLSHAIAFYAPEARPVIQRALDSAIATGQSWDLELQLIRADGVPIWVRAVGAVECENAQPVRLLGAFEDVTRRRRERTNLEDAQERIMLATESGGIGIWESDLVSGEVHWDAQSYRLHGMQPDWEPVTYALWAQRLHPDDLPGAEAAFQTSLATGQDFFSQYRVRWPDGSIHHIKGFGRVRRDAQGNALRIVGTNIDVTDAVHYAQSLEEARLKAEEATQSKGQFLANMSHEIRTPMNAILGMLQLLGNTELAPNQHDYLNKTEGAAKSLLGLLNDILDFSKIDAGKMELDLRPLRTDRLMRELAVVLSANVGGKTIEVLYDIDPAVPQTLVGDAMRLRQVLTNLAGNAIKFTSDGQVVVSLHRTPQDPDRSDVVGIDFAVQDTGIGIAPENQARIFSGFSQAESSTSRRFGGTGLGLAISQRLVELMGGRICLESALGAGSTFRFTLYFPVAGPESSTSVMPVAPVPNRVLLVDDNPVARAVLARMMRGFGWQVDEAASGQAALDLITTQPLEGGFTYQCVYLDWQMPALNGWDTLHQMRKLAHYQHGPVPKVVMLSANGRDGLSQRTQAEQSLLSSFLVKPVTASMLMDAALVQSADGEALRRAPRSSRRQLSGMRVLVAEDNAINQQVAEELLSFEGALVSIVGDGRQAVNAVASARQQFDAVLMDVQMPVMDGYAATRTIRKQLGLTRLPIIGLTANAMASDREACLKSGMDQHIGKPFDIASLVSMLIELTGFVPGAHDAAPDHPLGLPNGYFEGLPEVNRIAGMDLPGALSRLGGMSQVYVRAAVDLKNALAALEPKLEALLQAADLRGAEMLLHTVKGNAGTLGLNALAQALAVLEKLCRSQDDVAGVRKKAYLLGEDVAAAQLMLDAAVQTLLQREPATAVAAAGQTVAEVTHGAATNPGPALEFIAKQLIPLLEAQDLTALQVFADNRTLLESVPPSQIDPLEAALQDMDLDAALQACRSIVA